MTFTFASHTKRKFAYFHKFISALTVGRIKNRTIPSHSPASFVFKAANFYFDVVFPFIRADSLPVTTMENVYTRHIKNTKHVPKPFTIWLKWLMQVAPANRFIRIDKFYRSLYCMLIGPRHNILWCWLERARFDVFCASAVQIFEYCAVLWRELYWQP